jgi:hypothetical protein
VALTATLTSLCYLGGGFVWDDLTLIEQTLATLDVRGVLSLWVSPVTPDGPGAAYYRPVSMTVLAVLGRWGPFPIHVLGMALHVVSAVMLVRLCKQARWPLIAGLIFAVHPLASEVVGWCSALPDALAVALGLGATFSAREKRAGAILLLLLAALAKETGLLIPLAFGVAGLLPKRWWQGWLGVVGIIVVLRLVVSTHMGSGWMQNLDQAPQAIGWSLGALVWPVPLTAVRDLWVAPAGTIWLGLFVLLLLLAKAWGNRMALVGVGLVLAGPLLAIPVILDGHLAAERYLYISLVGFGIWASACLRTPRPRWVVAIPVLAALSVHFVRAPAWRDNVSLFSAAVSATPNSSYAWHFLGVSYANEGQSAAAAGAFEQAILTGHPHPEDRFMRLRTLVESGRGAEAIRWANSGPQSELTAQYIAWWARAALMVDDVEKAKALLSMLDRERYFDGPYWVADFARAVEQRSAMLQDDSEADTSIELEP